MLCALIMAGGKGTRFWPLSTEKMPKQFLNLIGSETMIQMTINRIKPIIPIEKIFVCTGEQYIDLVKSQLPELPDRNIIVEPEGRNTAPCIALSSFIINKYYKNSNMLVLPADHLINNEQAFRNLVVKYNSVLEFIRNGIVTFGITPTRAETGYGYIKCKDKGNINSNIIARIDEFVEKPNKEKAKHYLQEGSYFWNSGMFMWRTNYILNKFREYLPNTYDALHVLQEIEDSDIKEYINEQYKYTDNISIDYGILEKDKDIYMVEGSFGWDDVGNWEALDRYREKDEYGNIHVGNTKTLNGKNNLIISSNNKVVVEGLSNIYVIENDGKIIVGKKENVAEIKGLKEIM